MCHTAQFEAAKKALEQFHQDSDIDALRTSLFEIEIPAYCRREDFMEWIDRNLDGADLLDDPRNHPSLSLTSSASILYGIEP